MTHEVIPFGKHRGKTVEEVRGIDPQYLEWLSGQAWFRERNVTLYQTIVNYNAEPSETPEHNALQVKFLDDEFCRAFVRAACNIDEIFHRVLEDEANRLAEKQKELQKPGLWHGGCYTEDEKQAKLAAIPPRLAAIKCCSSFTIDVLDRTFEEHGIDVKFWSRLNVKSLAIEHSLGTWRVEIKPSVGDDYPAVLRQMRQNRADHLLVGMYNGAGATREQFIATMRSADITVVFVEQVEAEMAAARQ